MRTRRPRFQLDWSMKARSRPSSKSAADGLQLLRGAGARVQGAHHPTDRQRQLGRPTRWRRGGLSGEGPLDARLLSAIRYALADAGAGRSTRTRLSARIATSHQAVKVSGRHQTQEPLLGEREPWRIRTPMNGVLGMICAAARYGPLSGYCRDSVSTYSKSSTVFWIVQNRGRQAAVGSGGVQSVRCVARSSEAGVRARSRQGAGC